MLSCFLLLWQLPCREQRLFGCEKKEEECIVIMNGTCMCCRIYWVVKHMWLSFCCFKLRFSNSMLDLLPQHKKFLFVCASGVRLWIPVRRPLCAVTKFTSHSCENKQMFLFASQLSSDMDSQAESTSKDIMDTKIAQSTRTPKHGDG